MKGITIEDLPEKFRAQVRAQLGNRVAVSATHVEPPACHASVGKKETPRFAGLVRIVVGTITKRPRDADGTSAKYIVDSLVSAGILAGDSSKEVSEVSHRHDIGKEEKTIITITEVT